MIIASNKRNRTGITIHVYYEDGRAAYLALDLNAEWWLLIVDRIIPDKDANGYFSYNYDFMKPSQIQFLDTVMTYFFEDLRYPFSIATSWAVSNEEEKAIVSCGFHRYGDKFIAHSCKWKEVIELMRQL